MGRNHHPKMRANRKDSIRASFSILAEHQLPIPRLHLRTDKIRQPALFEIKFQEIPHERLHNIPRQILQLIKSSFSSPHTLATVQLRADLEEFFDVVVVEVG